MAKKSTKKTLKPVRPQLGDGVEILNAGSVLEDPITRTLETNYMPYAMSVIVSRALPEIDGFKPAHRKLLYTMYEMGLIKGARTKSANIVGSTMHLNPHGDAAIYDTMVRMGRGNESLLVPFVDSKGNFGKAYSRDMSCAAARYTEAKLEGVGEELFRDIDKETVDFVPNYDSTTTEPTLLPVTFPTILANNTLGIAVGMACNICSFNLAELCATTVALMKDEKHDISTTMPAPDFVGGGQILYDEAQMREIYENGRGSVKVRARYNVVPGENMIEVTQIPPTTTVEAIMDKIAEEYPDLTAADLDLVSYKMQKFVVRRWLLDDGKRVDGRGINEIRPLAAEVGILPRVHGSGMFTRGQTQVLTTCTLGGTKDNQLMDDLTDEQTKRYIHHYNFPPYSVGEARAPRSPGRREIGHGALAERALVPVLPSLEEFPYTIRCVSEVLSSNGSTSQASICGSTLALMDAGVPIKAPVAGISCGLITEGERWMTMLDIQGVEDFHGDMDFKVGGTRKGITAIQMDIKIDGLTYDIIAEAFEKCRKGRLYILDEIIKPVIAEPRHELSRYAPKMFSMMIPTDKIKDVIGKGGKVIQDICATCNCKIDVQEDGHVFVSAVDQEDAKRAIFTIKTIVEDPEIGAIYKGKVTRLMNFGAFVEIAPGKEGLVHISKLDTKRVERVEDVVAVGDAIVVKVTDIDQQGRINLSRRDAILALEAKKAAQQQ
mgnify:CR=1 FL=1